ncbi:MAG: ATPase [Alloprevotella sp.]|nr:ATPase [Alloprevotella sp.]
MPTLIADSGSTKTHWLFISRSGEEEHVLTEGLNPLTRSEEEITRMLLALRSRLPEAPTQLAFYGAGCRGRGREVMRERLSEVFPGAAGTMEVESDLLGAARGALGREAGVVCIVGTGTNSGLYDGRRLVRNVPPLGFILGDEGGGAALGRQLLNRCLRGCLSEELTAAFRAAYPDADEGSVIEHVYRRPSANTYLAHFAPFVVEHRKDAGIKEIILSEFDKFFQYQLAPYGLDATTPLSFVGGLAYALREELCAAAQRRGFSVRSIMQEPIEGLRDYHAAR